MSLQRLFQVRLRTLLVIMLVVASGVMLYGERWRAEYRCNSAVEYLTRRGATVRVVPSLRGPTAEVAIDANTLWTDAGSIGGGSLSTRNGASSAPPRLTLEDFEQLRLVPRLTALSIEGDLLTPEALAGIATLDSLERLDISHAPLEDKQLQTLAPLTNLRELNLEATQVTDAGVLQFTTALPKLVVNDD